MYDDDVTEDELDELLLDAGLAEAERWRDSIETAISERLASETSAPRNAVERHWRECGHRLAPGCCAVPHTAFG
jgi:hypothetical protein